MSIDWFLQLKEIDSLTKMRNGHLKAIHEQEDRLLKLNKRLEDSVLQTAKLRQDNFTLQQSLHEIEKKLQLYQKQRQNLMDIGESGEKFSAQIDEAEGQGLTLIDTIEKNEKELADQKQFEGGLRKTIEEIEQEVNAIRSSEEQAIKNIDLRIQLLEEELPANFRDLLHKISARNLAHGPFTRNQGGSCYFCRYKISRIDESEIDLQRELKQCPQCSRIFLPYGS